MLSPRSGTIEDTRCIDNRAVFELISTEGHHCDVWRTSGVKRRGQRRKRFDVVVKIYREECEFPMLRVLEKEYRLIRAQLEDIVPASVFVLGGMGGPTKALAIAESVNPWFNVANPVNEAEAIPLLRRLPKAQNQLLRFCHAARKWEFEKHAKIIDLYGVDNLVLNTDRELRYLDSFHVFFYTDMLKLDPDDEILRRKMEVSVKRRQYLDNVLDEVKKTCVAVTK
ncbi:MAG: hypothetical protein OES09_01315 [Gammaproteobacteria bacterium]|nr:hypothetical protein [Gammaproteobacteria bacterium]